MKNTTIKSLIMILVFSLVLSGCSLAQQEKVKILTIEEAKNKALQFINDNLMKPDSKAEIATTTEENGLYKFVVNIGREENIDSYMTKDGKKFFPNVMDIEEIEKETKQKETELSEEEESSIQTITKTDNPKVELFVMSHCPYGTQIEKGIIPVLEILKDKVDFELKFCDYAMHGKKELDEQLRQHCIQKQGTDKIINYLKCFLVDDKAEECVKSTKGINATDLNACIATTDKEYKVTEQFNNKETWKSGKFPAFDVYKKDNEKYKIAGSPNLVINGNKTSSSRSAAELLKTVCSGFNNPPEECNNAQLSSATPSPGFGFEASGNGSDATCN
ncbi:MAG: hypothetical protein ABII94_05035 [Patescibacteria group bacterium]|nr:hypothetical protein [Patescibacteria group bacterium]